MRNIAILILFCIPFVTQAAPEIPEKNSAMMLKYALMKPLSVSGSGGDPTSAITFNDEAFKEISIGSPPFKKFSIDISAAITEKDEVERIGAQLRWGGILTVINQGKVSGTFNEDSGGNFIFPNSSKLFSEIGQTLLPSEKEFSGDYSFYAIGFPEKHYPSFWRGIYYKEYQAPVEYSITHLNSNDFSSFSDEPFAVIDAEYKTRSFGYFQRVSNLSASLRNGRIPKRAIVFGKPNSAFVLLTGDIMLGYAEHDVGKKVKADFANATNGLTLEIDDEFHPNYAMFIAQEWGWLAIKRNNFVSYALSIGFAIEFNMYLDTIFGDGPRVDTGSTASGKAIAGYNRDVMDILYGGFIRLGVLF